MLLVLLVSVELVTVIGWAIGRARTDWRWFGWLGGLAGAANVVTTGLVMVSLS